MSTKTRIYLGRHGKTYEIFRSAVRPDAVTHGHLYTHVIGPFYTMRAAVFMRDFGRDNPHLQCVADAERIVAQARLYATRAA